MGLPKVNTCCCGCTLQTGSKIIGYFGAVCAVIVVLVFTVSLVGLSGVTPSNADEKNAIFVIQLIVGFSLALCIISAIFYILLIVGATIGRASFLTAWIIYATIALAVSTILYISSCVSHFGAGHTDQGISSLVSLFVSLALSMYFIIVVSSYRKELAGERR